MPWIETARTEQPESKPGFDLITVTQENLDAGAQQPQWPLGAFNREFTQADGKAIARHSVYTKKQPSYTIRGSMSQEPLATHPMFQKGADKIEQDEWGKYKKWQSDPTSVDWTPDGPKASASFKKYWSFVERGIEYFLNGTVEMQITEIVSSQPSIRQLGRRDTPPNAPSLPNGRDWLVVGVDADNLGVGEWRQTTTYRASMDDGWDQGIYK
jgi:hypothetical protein